MTHFVIDSLHGLKQSKGLDKMILLLYSPFFGRESNNKTDKTKMEVGKEFNVSNNWLKATNFAYLPPELVGFIYLYSLGCICRAVFASGFLLFERVNVQNETVGIS